MQSNADGCCLGSDPAADHVDWDAVIGAGSSAPRTTRIWWRNTTGTIESLEVDADIARRVRPLIDSGYLQQHLGAMINAYAAQMSIPKLNGRFLWKRAGDGMTKSAFVGRILDELARRFENGSLQIEREAVR